MNRVGQFPWVQLCIATAAVVFLSTQVIASDRSDHGARATVHDQRYGHDQHYPPRGHIVHALPRDAYVSRWRGTTYHFHAGVWYRPERSHWVAVTPPPGLVVPFLPPFYTTIWIDGAPYYYANGVYYVWRSSPRSYFIVKPPPGDSALGSPDAPSDLYVYPRNGQNAEQQATDRYECHHWSVGETGFDPTQPSGGVEQAQATSRRNAYYRALTACLEGRGYSVK